MTCCLTLSFIQQLCHVNIAIGGFSSAIPLFVVSITLVWPLGFLNKSQTLPTKSLVNHNKAPVVWEWGHSGH